MNRRPDAEPGEPIPPARAPDDPALKLWVILSRAHAAVSAHAAVDAAGYGMTLTEFAILEALYHKIERTAGEVADGRYSAVLMREPAGSFPANKFEQVEAIIQSRKVLWAEAGSDITGEVQTRMDSVYGHK